MISRTFKDQGWSAEPSRIKDGQPNFQLLVDWNCGKVFGCTLKSISFDTFSNIKVCLCILDTLPVTSRTCERSFSAMKRLKTYTRSTMVSERLNGIALMHIHQEIVPDVKLFFVYSSFT